MFNVFYSNDGRIWIMVPAGPFTSVGNAGRWIEANKDRYASGFVSWQIRDVSFGAP